MTAVTGRIYTQDDLLHLPQRAGKTELVAGEFRTMSPPNFYHGYTASRIVHYLQSVVIPNNLGVVCVETGYVLSKNPDTVRLPDVSFIKAARLADLVNREGYIHGPPDLAIEVLSPDDSFADMSEKVEQYLSSGTSLVWVLDPRKKTVMIFAPQRPVQTLTAEDSIDAEGVIPGFSCKVELFFPS
jgi:Uma2 family endonuclease